ncbi:hypothetical protein PMAYCL1PPCAC_20597 [Pristionchus mayeri]|uniref:Uncharacterized protein n=1 Tax=Pristionchus mayeri TaxID=1317129 RepID=A0AAN5CTQ4_9BILA|nr:hypothetical protein PMAYCL1PPCAC_20597 [Pristionchus mayeri]
MHSRARIRKLVQPILDLIVEDQRQSASTGTDKELLRNAFSQGLNCLLPQLVAQLLANTRNFLEVFVVYVLQDELLPCISEVYFLCIESLNFSLTLTFSCPVRANRSGSRRIPST